MEFNMVELKITTTSEQERAIEIMQFDFVRHMNNEANVVLTKILRQAKAAVVENETLTSIENRV